MWKLYLSIKIPHHEIRQNYGIFHSASLAFNRNVAFSTNIDLNNLKIRISNNPCDRITKESLKPLATNKL